VSDLSFCYLNIRSILANSNIGVPRLEVLYNFCCRDNDFDIILLTETHLDDLIDLSEISFDGYQLFVKNRPRYGGGILIYAKSYLSPVLCTDIDQSGMEFVFVKLLSLSSPVFFGVYYRPPNQPKVLQDAFLESSRSQFDFLCTMPNLKFFMFGDLNDRYVDWNDGHPGSELGSSLVYLLNEYDVTQTITRPTRGNIYLTCS